MYRIKKNMIRCTHCGDIIESKTIHDFVWCSCHSVAVDGGHDYLRRCFRASHNDFIELSELEESNEDGESNVVRKG